MFKKNLFLLIFLISLLLIFTGTLSPEVRALEKSYYNYLPLAQNGLPWTDGCYAPGTRNYKDSLPEPIVLDPILNQGTVITVTTTADDVDGDVSTVQGLLTDPGPDGLSLREAILSVNDDPGEYTITFAHDLKGSTIVIGGTGNYYLPPLLAGAVLINGDTDDDNLPDITLTASSTIEYPVGLRILSSNQSLNGLYLEGFFHCCQYIPASGRQLV